MKLVRETYKLTDGFPSEEQYGLKNQIRRAAVSIPSNISEGAVRNSKREFIKFLYIALGSIAELETQFIIAKELEYIRKEQNYVFGLIEELRRKLLRFVGCLKMDVEGS